MSTYHNEEKIKNLLEGRAKKLKQDKEKKSKDKNGGKNILEQASNVSSILERGREIKDTPGVLEQMLQDLKERYSFINIENRHLYYYIEKEGYWRLIPVNVADIELRVLLTSRWIKSINTSTMGELYKWLLIETDTKDASVFQRGREYLNFKDCAYNWDTGEIAYDRKKLYFSYVLATKYPKKKSTGAFDSFIEDVLGDDKATRREFSKFVGLAISDIRNLKYIIHLFGPSNSGKSTALNAIKHVVGSNVCAALSFSQLSQEFYLSSLHGCRLNISGEISGVSTTKLDALKSLSGNDTVAASHKFRDSFQFDNRALLIFACNVLPNISDYMELQSYVSRMVIFPFRRVFERSEWRDIDQELREDVAGIVEFAIEGLRRLKKDNYQIRESEAMLLCKKNYTGIYDSFSMFCEEYIKEESGSFLTSAEIREAYKKYCAKYQYEILSDVKWSQVLQRSYFCRKDTVSISDEAQGQKLARGYKGIKFRKRIGELEKCEIPGKDLSEIIDEAYKK